MEEEANSDFKGPIRFFSASPSFIELLIFRFVIQVIPFEEWQDEYFPTNCWGVVYIMSSEVRDNLIQVGTTRDYLTKFR
jgi:hypothetical protein